MTGANLYDLMSCTQKHIAPRASAAKLVVLHSALYFGLKHLSVLFLYFLIRFDLLF